eukprot:358210-Chlamydomonas_euryale.AAC.6
MDVIPGHDNPTLSTLEARAGPYVKCIPHTRTQSAPNFASPLPFKKCAPDGECGRGCGGGASTVPRRLHVRRCSVALVSASPRGSHHHHHMKI